MNFGFIIQHMPETPNAQHKDWTCGGMYSNGAVGLAKLRRDGFVSLHAGFDQANVTTRKLQFSGGRLFVNANTVNSILFAECLQEDGSVFPDFPRMNALDITAIQPVRKFHGAMRR